MFPLDHMAQQQRIAMFKRIKDNKVPVRKWPTVEPVTVDFLRRCFPRVPVDVIRFIIFPIAFDPWLMCTILPLCQHFNCRHHDMPRTLLSNPLHVPYRLAVLYRDTAVADPDNFPEFLAWCIDMDQVGASINESAHLSRDLPIWFQATYGGQATYCVTKYDRIPYLVPNSDQLTTLIDHENADRTFTFGILCICEAGKCKDRLCPGNRVHHLHSTSFDPRWIVRTMGQFDLNANEISTGLYARWRDARNAMDRDITYWQNRAKVTLACKRLRDDRGRFLKRKGGVLH